jgi:S-formylglutathione hydrolase
VCESFDTEITPERYLRESLVPWMRAEWQLSARAIAVAGVEMGGQGALRLAFKHPNEWPVAASISGSLDCQEWYGRGTPLDEMYETRERCRQDTAILHLDGHKWPPHIWFCCELTDALTYRGNDRLSEKLNAMGVPHTSDLDTRVTTGPTYFEQMTAPMLAFVAAALAREAKRLA